MSHDVFPTFFADVPPIALRDPLAELLGAVPEGSVLEYTFADAVKAAGHVCPTVVGGWLVTAAGLAALYPDGATPVRGDIAVRAMGAPEHFGYGPMAQVVGYLTGAAGDTGFRGLAGRHGRHGRAGLLSFHPETPALATFEFERTDTGATVRVSYSPDSVPPAPEMRQAMAGALAGDHEVGASFRRLWLDRARRILEARDQVIEVTVLGAGHHRRG
jgi:hypothetical protein